MSQPSMWAFKAALALAAAVGLVLPAAAQQPKPPSWSHAFDLKCRSHKDPKFDKARAFGVEVFRDENNGNGIYIIETGDLAAVNGFKGLALPGNKGRAPGWMHGLDLKVRPAGVDSFDKAITFGLEVFRDENFGHFLYIAEKGTISVAPGAPASGVDNKNPAAPKWVHGVDLKVRKGGEKAFTKDTKVWSIEVFVDENNGNLVYICESGMIAIVPGFKGTTAPKDAKAPVWLHGLDLKVRKGGQKDFDGTTKTYGLEVFHDENNGNLIYISETGSISVVPNKKSLTAPTKEPPAEPVWTHGLDLKVREAGKKDFTKDTPLFGVEVFNDENTGCTIYICETGAIAAVPKQ